VGTREARSARTPRLAHFVFARSSSSPKGLQSNSGGFVRDDSASATHDRDDRDALSVALNERRPQTVGQFGGLGLGGKLAEREGFGLSAIL